MPVPAVGGITLDGVIFTTDPTVYEPLNWQKRMSIQMAIGGKVTIQDFGVFQKDNTVRLGGENFLEDAVVQSLHTKYRTRGATYAFTDWLGNSFTVFIKTFVPVPLKKGPGVSLYRYTMELQVLTITNLFGVAYTGS